MRTSRKRHGEAKADRGGFGSNAVVLLMFNLDPEELHPFPERLFRRALQVPANLRDLVEDLDREIASRLDFERARLWQREHIYDDWRKFERDLPLLIPYHSEPDQHLLLCLLLEHQTQADRLMPADRTPEQLDLTWMLISWATGRRPREERRGLVEAAVERQPDPRTYQEVQEMSTTLGQTLEQWAQERGREQGIEQGVKQGQIGALRGLLHHWLEDRFGPLPDDVRERIERAQDLGRLEKAIRQCPSLGSLDDFVL